MIAKNRAQLKAWIKNMSARTEIIYLCLIYHIIWLYVDEHMNLLK